MGMFWINGEHCGEQRRRFKMTQATTKLTKHFGKPVLVETEAVEIARIPITGDRLEESIILHPRYVPRNIKYEKMFVRGRRRGRTMDILLDDPIERDEQTYGVLNFKGVGRDAADTAMVIHPTRWYLYDGKRYRWESRKNGDRYGRRWGAVTKQQALAEFTNPIFDQFQIPHTPYIAMHDIPQEISDYICKVHSGTLSPLSQIVRAFSTNIREDEAPSDLKYGYCLPEKLADMDAKMINAQLKVAQEGKNIILEGSIRENRCIDGLWTDKENFYIANCDYHRPAVFVSDMVMYSLEMCKSTEWLNTYLQILKEKTGLEFNKDVVRQRTTFIDPHVRKLNLSRWMYEIMIRPFERAYQAWDDKQK